MTTSPSCAVPELPADVGHGGDDRIAVRLGSEVAYVLIGSGTKRNALRTADWIALAAVVGELASRSDLKVVVIRGVDGSFSSGSDLSEWQSADARYVNRTFQAMEAALEAVEQLEVVTIAAVEGAATGAGCELALACDLRIVSRSARMGMPVVRHSIRVSPSFALRLTQGIGVSHAKQLLYTGRLMGSEQAERCGLASEVVDDDQFDTRLTRLVDRVAAQPRGALVVAKQSTNRAAEHCRHDLRDPGWEYVDGEDFSDRISEFFNELDRTNEDSAPHCSQRIQEESS